MSNLCIQQQNTLFLPPMLFFLMFCYHFWPVGFEILTLIGNPIGVGRTPLHVLLDVCLCMANICLWSTCTELTWTVSPWSMKDLYMLLQGAFRNKLFITSFTLQSCINVFVSPVNTSVGPFSAFIHLFCDSPCQFLC